MRTVDLIQKKVDALALSREEIAYLVNAFVAGSVSSDQMAAFLMAVVCRGMDEREATDLTLAMMHSGDVVDLSDIPGVKVDKHSTGGVGDTTTLVVAPLVAACGGTVAKMSGRGLGHTGGTLDKLEAIPGVKVEQSIEAFKRMLRENKLAVIGQSANLDPADKHMYALRDVTATVHSIPLIASSVMSKKLAAGADAIVLDVKTGSGAFCESEAEARELARLMVRMGANLGRRVVAVITDMNQPLGMAVGNALEVREAVELLSGRIPESEPLFRVCMLLATQMLLLSGVAAGENEAKAMLSQALDSGRALQKLKEMIAELGGDASYIDINRIGELCRVKRKLALYPRSEGYIVDMHAKNIGNAAQMLGAGRAVASDTVDHAVGLVMDRRLGDFVDLKTPLCMLYINDASRLDEAVETFYDGIVISEKPPESLPPMVCGLIRPEDAL